MDTMTKEQRHRCMAHNKSKDTGPEMAVRRLLFALGFRYRLHAKELPGKPDIVFRKQRKVIFVHGCFWHGHNCTTAGRVPKANGAFWRKKFARNKERDAKTLRLLWETGWEVLVVWECETKDTDHLRNRLLDFLKPPSFYARTVYEDLETLYAAETNDAYDGEQ
ncbi:MAG: DNA mismatch endonuclease Vsr [Kiritimatiellae bacterium]|nr:DNA mismatch endonuclease Vsr [Kiritimatiellia bacterium]